MIIPVLRNYDATQIIGTVEISADKGLLVKMTQPITRDELFSIFGGVGFKILEQKNGDDGVVRIRRFEIIGFSL